MIICSQTWAGVQSGESGQLRNEKLMDFVNYFVELCSPFRPECGGWDGDVAVRAA